MELYPMLPVKQLLNVNITNTSYNEIINIILKLAKQHSSGMICIANVHMIIEAYLHPPFREILNQAAIVTPDGKPLSFFMNLFYGTKQSRVTGPDLMIDLFTSAANQDLSIFFYGASESVLNSMRKKLIQDYPNLKIAGMFSPPFKEVTPEEDEQHITLINQSGAHIVFVALGCPKQELWMHKHQGKIHSVMIGVGAAFPFFTGHLKRAPQWMQNLSLEWLYRLWKEPRRLFKRYLITNTLFLFLIHIQLLDRICRSHNYSCK